jgi:hypothetical protein
MNWAQYNAVQFNESKWCGASAEARELVYKLTDVDPGTRYSVEEALAHRWLMEKAPPAPQGHLQTHLRLWNAKRKIGRVHRCSGSVLKFSKIGEQLKEEEEEGDDEPEQ